MAAAAASMTKTSPSSSAATASGPSLAQQIDEQVDCEDLALRLGLERPGDKGRFVNPLSKRGLPTIICFKATADSASRWEDRDLSVGNGGELLVQLTHDGGR
ncbi:MAG: hypothetical protein K2W93_07120, partial [Burkholderiaceae bacterium]|nr:hypothetical protein [Burkholderiaceae bacterium]